MVFEGGRDESSTISQLSAFEEAVAAFKEGRFREPTNKVPFWHEGFLVGSSSSHAMYAWRKSNSIQVYPLQIEGNFTSMLRSSRFFRCFQKRFESPQEWEKEITKTEAGNLRH